MTEAQLEALIEARAAAKTAKMRGEIDDLELWMRGALQKLNDQYAAHQARFDAILLEREHSLLALMRRVGFGDDVDETPAQTLN